MPEVTGALAVNGGEITENTASQSVGVHLVHDDPEVTKEAFFCKKTLQYFHNML